MSNTGRAIRMTRIQLAGLSQQSSSLSKPSKPSPNTAAAAVAAGIKDKVWNV